MAIYLYPFCGWTLGSNLSINIQRRTVIGRLFGYLCCGYCDFYYVYISAVRNVSTGGVKLAF